MGMQGEVTLSRSRLYFPISPQETCREQTAPSVNVIQLFQRGICNLLETVTGKFQPVENRNPFVTLHDSHSQILLFLNDLAGFSVSYVQLTTLCKHFTAQPAHFYSIAHVHAYILYISHKTVCLLQFWHFWNSSTFCPNKNVISSKVSAKAREQLMVVSNARLNEEEKLRQPLM